MIRSVKELKRLISARASGDEVERDEDGRAIIELTVLRDEGFLSDFSAGTRPVISGEVAQYLEESAMRFLPKEPICIKIYGDCIDKMEEKLYIDGLKEYYVRHYEHNRGQLKRNLLFSVIMAVIGIFGIAAALAISFYGKIPVLAEAVDIFAWVFLWEAVDLFFLQRSLLRVERNRCLRFFEAKILFLPLADRRARAVSES